MIDRERMTGFFLELVKIDSHSREERDVAERLLRELASLDVPARIDEAAAAVGGNSGNVVGRLPGNAPGAPPLLLSAHMDTVPPGKGVKPVREDGRIRSDGTTVLGGDDKSGLAVIIEVLRALRERQVPHGDVEIAFTICEEAGLLGAKHLDLAAFAARQAIVLDSPYSTTLFTRAPAADRFEFVVHGLEAHAGVAPESGISAVRVAAEAIAAAPLGRVDEQTTANLVIVEGGGPTNVVPNRCVVRGESRSLDEARLDEQTAAIRRCFQTAAARATATVDGKLNRAWIEERCERDYHSMHVPDDAAVTQLVLRTARALGRDLRTASIGGGSDCNVLVRRGIPAVNLGTGMRNIHTVNEWLDLDDFYACGELALQCVLENARGGADR